VSKTNDSDSDGSYVPLSFDDWFRNWDRTLTPTRTSASQASKRTRSSRRRQLDPDEQLYLIELALKWADIWWQCQDQKVVETAVALAFEEKHDWRLKSVRSELLDLEMKWRSGESTGFSAQLSRDMLQWLKTLDAQREIERDMLSGNQDHPPEAATFTWKRVCIAGMLLLLGWMILDFCCCSCNTKPTYPLNG